MASTKESSSFEGVPLIRSEITYLEMTANPKLSEPDLGVFRLQRVENLSVEDYLDIYREIGRDYLWNYRPGQTSSEISKIINAPSTLIYLLYSGDEAVGMAELDAVNPNDIELVHFGLLPRFLNQGIGRTFLQAVLYLVWSRDVKRMWLSTCGMDHPKALRFYESAGFVPFKSTAGNFKDWRFTGFYEMSDAPQIPYGKQRIEKE